MDDREQQNRQELIRREMYRRSRDLIRVYNPLSHDFRFFYDGFLQTIKSKQTRDIERYLARLYFKKIAEFMIGQQMLKKGEELIATRKAQGYPDILDKYDLNREIWDKTPRLDNPDLLKEIRAIVVLGLVEEYGLDFPEEPQRSPTESYDPRSLHEQIFDSFDQKIDPTQSVEPLRPLKKADATI